MRFTKVGFKKGFYSTVVSKVVGFSGHHLPKWPKNGVFSGFFRKSGKSADFGPEFPPARTNFPRGAKKGLFPGIGFFGPKRASFLLARFWPFWTHS